ncbi:VOC family protein [Sphingomonas sp. LY54]|uniref:VOC family protein n=1 Tax=Sphingomonas sp. LY54 TaxID=3095343 RepID=UPI002D789FC8|nr:VOC family protein [Sphingomonas sp. LY54]WRP29477.1 VOC family protein [Sphingomonas sp. LY54]
MMETMQLHRGRLIDHIQLIVADLGASRRFYDAVFDVLDVPLGGGAESHFWYDELFVSSPDSPEALGRLTGRHHLAFQAKDRATVDAFHAAGLAAGGTDNGAPGERPYHPGYYAAFLLDPDGNNIEAVYHGEAQRSAPSVKIEF